MAWRRDIKTAFEYNDGVDHPDLQHVNTRVSEYLRKYGTGQIDKIPQDTRQEITDNRTPDQMLAEGEMVPGLGTDDLDVMQELSRMRERYVAAIEAINMDKSDKNKFDKAMKVINDKNASYEAQMDAYRILEELEQKGKITRARD